MMVFYYDKETLEFKKVRGYKVVIATAILGLVILLQGNIPPPIVVKVPYYDVVKVCDKPTPQEKGFTEQELICYLKEINVKFPHIVLAQAKIESNNYTSDIFKENYNLFGMKEAVVRPHLAKGTNRHHAYYANWKESVLDYVLWQVTQTSHIKTEKEYYSYLSENYAEATHYVEAVKRIVAREKLEEAF